MNGSPTAPKATDRPNRQSDNALHPLVSFALKTAIVAVAATASLLILINAVVSDVDEAIDRRLAQIRVRLMDVDNHRAFWAHVERMLDRAAASSNEMPPEQEQKILRDLKVLVDRARPFLQVLSAASAPPEEKHGE